MSRPEELAARGVVRSWQVANAKVVSRTAFSGYAYLQSLFGSRRKILVLGVVVCLGGSLQDWRRAVAPSFM